MEYKEIIDKIRLELDKVINFLERELAKIRVGRVSISLVEDIMIDCFGKKMPLKQLAAISTPGPQQIIIQPWDDSYIEAIQKAIERASLGANPIADKKLIRLSLPPLSEEYRQNLIKLLSEKKEAARQTVRHWREEAWKEIQERFKTKEISEDDKYKAKDQLQDLIDQYNKKIEERIEKKKKEIEL